MPLLHAVMLKQEVPKKQHCAREGTNKCKQTPHVVIA